ncbi:peroxidase superfamily protein [Artemisia annua]|uniref:peroxidase n=1 Tax=Artemisia annua TaxID=35608 RepID=A0A2U1NHN5_ARTAN|nr:peroxidase superfamily protein [Artemisia annua]
MSPPESTSPPESLVARGNPADPAPTPTTHQAVSFGWRAPGTTSERFPGARTRTLARRLNAKAQLESMCPGVVSCADIVAMAARDAVALVETGRKDGLVSRMELAARMPDVQDSIQILKQKFIEKGVMSILIAIRSHEYERFQID